MAGRGPAPKQGERLGRSKSKAAAVTMVAFGSDQPRRPLPDGEWNERAVQWWEAASSSPSSQVWDDADWQAAERALAMVHHWWKLMGENRVSAALRLGGELRRQEAALVLGMAERLRAGIRVGGPGPDPQPPTDHRAGMRARLAVRDDPPS
ncbi:MAG: hypothetical protein ACRCW4_10100 [Candidatus Neomicrothrix subdominans]